jgi:hypothetical protein
LYADPDPDPTAQINADPCGSGSGSETLGLVFESKTNPGGFEDIPVSESRAGTIEQYSAYNFTGKK